MCQLASRCNKWCLAERVVGCCEKRKGVKDDNNEEHDSMKLYLSGAGKARGGEEKWKSYPY